MNNQSNPQLGQLVKIRKGRNADQAAVIVAIADSRFVYIADGDKRKFDQPKKKSLLHLELQPMISSEVVNSLNECGRVTNGKLRYAVHSFLESTNIQAEEKGD
ncbi:hypothetical protein HF638_27265 [Paenibacillus sp. SZ31]|uniref:KOW domain-containing RNA-binding protein n=1 Tax=unclassified Paenibacillus TaxID=185978 RepID=UPI000CF8D924|nr:MULTISPECIES: KOW domain-containing RNA-binding protein [unclassified Paenibacillus]MCW3795979.1 KOW domain-containing RNA-binding protein [Paenibacillus sp. LS1]NMI07701.1 hypothetical protein [Paenibacillus sp. SZ31]PQP84701.1 hypothetical protein C0Q44_09190 [Paenibacillus sp. PCH8]